MIVLVADHALHHSEIIAEMELAGRLDAGKDPHTCLRKTPLAWLRNSRSPGAGSVLERLRLELDLDHADLVTGLELAVIVHADAAFKAFSDLAGVVLEALET